MDQRELRRQYTDLLDRLRADDWVLGVVLSGSQARAGTATERSDYDVLVVARDEHVDELAAERRRTPELDLAVTGLTAFRRHALPGSEYVWDRYSYAYAQVVLDRDGQVGPLVAEKAALGEAEAATLAPRLLDQFLNSVYRALKNDRDGRGLAARLDAAEAVRPMIGYVFALARRVEPYNKYLEWELERFPLPVPGWDLASTRRVVGSLLRPVDVSVGVRQAFAAVEPTAREHGHGDVVDGWGADVELMRGTPES
ncbi:nucleotidyltransferase domain-containing protein [Microlunatus capsulatus]|uniref:Nucleotidyltransferase n=1 Tax=Microlunatus capsulatus TaxID=99117 RepID=A0ABS4Z3K8_9ACTN|nr:nucleotidyltransferase domain-containing protein [Microlunatus capsulatus]MBP2415380.1 putative nucleotidyltransferase [Microlunatus capsulatus]